MDYLEWAREYEYSASSILKRIERLKQKKSLPGISADEKRIINDTIRAYRSIYHELCDVAAILRCRGGKNDR